MYHSSPPERGDEDLKGPNILEVEDCSGSGSTDGAQFTGRN